MVKKIVFIFIILIGIAYQNFAQITITISNKSIDSLNYKSKTMWITLTPFFIVNRKFSPDNGETWKNVGMFGQKLKPYLLTDSIATENINIYKYTRMAGIAQMWVIAPLLAYRHFTYVPSISTGDEVIDENTYLEEESGYLTASILIFITGNFTYHILAKTYLFRSLHDYNRGILSNQYFENTSVNFNFQIDSQTQTPLVGIAITF